MCVCMYVCAGGEVANVSQNKQPLFPSTTFTCYVFLTEQYRVPCERQTACLYVMYINFSLKCIQDLYGTVKDVW